jgi:glycosyltransferase involved in cell wall biosynthesis
LLLSPDPGFDARTLSGREIMARIRKTSQSDKKIAVLVPCYNEEVTVEKVVRDFKRELPDSVIYVYDNNSTDRTAELARKAGAIVVTSPIQGKGNVVRQMFDEIEADVYILTDGDDTYPAEDVHELIEVFEKKGYDMLVGSRLSEFEDKSFRRFHQIGNKLITGLIGILFHVPISDMLSGYRIFRRSFVKTIPLMSSGFEVETELTLQSVAKGFRFGEHPIPYRKRPEGSYSKLNTWSDGFLVLKSIFLIFRYYRPLFFFTAVSLIFALFSLIAGYQPVIEYIEMKYVYAVPRAILASGLGVLSLFSLGIGMILETVIRLHNEKFLLLSRILSKKPGE